MTTREEFEAYRKKDSPLRLGLSRSTSPGHEDEYGDPFVQQAWEAWRDATLAERERCAKVCDEEYAYRIQREDNPLPGDTSSVQGHKAVTAHSLASKIRKGEAP
jgi:hypothetical protein